MKATHFMATYRSGPASEALAQEALREATDTPRTDAEIDKVPHANGDVQEVVDAEVARGLERDLREALKKVDRFTAAFQIEQMYSGSHRLVVVAPNGDTQVFNANGERAERVLIACKASLNMEQL